MNRKWAHAAMISAIGMMAIAGVVFGVPAIGNWAQQTFSPGMGLKTAAIIAFIIGFVMILVMAAVAGDGILGELSVMVLGFLLFFVICWLMLAWVF